MTWLLQCGYHKRKNTCVNEKTFGMIWFTTRNCDLQYLPLRYSFCGDICKFMNCGVASDHDNHICRYEMLSITLAISMLCGKYAIALHDNIHLMIVIKPTKHDVEWADFFGQRWGRLLDYHAISFEPEYLCYMNIVNSWSVYLRHIQMSSECTRQAVIQNTVTQTAWRLQHDYSDPLGVVLSRTKTMDLYPVSRVTWTLRFRVTTYVMLTGVVKLDPINKPANRLRRAPAFVIVM